jgi:exodeoxyribonuclease-5
MKLTQQQDNALKEADKWLTTESKTKPFFYIAGFAGTGKTTIAKHFANNINGTVCYAAYTGKAALMMRKNGCYGATTIHKLIYKSNVDKSGKVYFSINYASPLFAASLLVIDECSMVNDKIAKDLLSFKVPILVLGDPAQLPPVSGAGYFTENTPDVMLTEIHRQATDNPIIYLATQVRNGNKLDYGNYGESRIIRNIQDEHIFESDQFLVGRNVTREAYNNHVRTTIGLTDLYPTNDEKLICLKNDYKCGIYNGGMFNVVDRYDKKIDSDFCELTVVSDDEKAQPVHVSVHKSFLNPQYQKPKHWTLLKDTQQFDYGYCITTHKSQGSQWDNVLIIDESWCFRDDWQRWAYTAITRASEKITFIK